MADASITLPRARLGASALRVLGDDRLAALAARGDDRAFTVIFERHHQALYRYCRSILGNEEDAADALQSTMVSAWRALPGERRAIALKPWLYRIAHNEAISLVRRRRPQDPLEEAPALESAGPEARAIARERVDRLFDDLGELPDRQRGAIVMRELGGLSYDEIAAAFATTPAAATQAVFDARKTLHDFEAGRGMQCDSVQREISRRDGRVLMSRRLRAHMRSCAECTQFRAMIDERSKDFAVLAPGLPAVAAAALLEGLRTGGGVAGGGGLTVFAGATGSKALMSSAALKVTAGVVAAASVGASAAVVVPGADRPARPALPAVAPITAAPGTATAIDAVGRSGAPGTAAERSTGGRSRPARGHGRGVGPNRGRGSATGPTASGKPAGHGSARSRRDAAPGRSGKRNAAKDKAKREKSARARARRRTRARRAPARPLRTVKPTRPAKTAPATAVPVAPATESTTTETTTTETTPPSGKAEGAGAKLLGETAGS